jgi:hypothetical protein
MSDSHDDHGHSGDDHAHAHAHDEFDPEPATELGADEPRTAGWLPIVGAGLFLIGGVVFLVKQSDAAPGATSASASASAAKVASAAPNPNAPPTDPAKRQELADQAKRRVPRLPASGSAMPRTGPPPGGQPPPRPAPTGRP